jgi:Na+/proline symporter
VTPLVAAILAYLVLQFAIGAWVSRRVRTEDDYLVAGRRLGYPLTIFSIFATWFGAETCIGGAGRAYRGGLSLASPEPFGYGLCLVAMGLFFAVPLWRRKLTTFADLFRQRWSPAVERTAAVLLVPGSVLWAAAQMRGFGHVLASTTDLDPVLALTVAAAFCVLYTVFGGLLADAVTDLVQGLVLTAGLFWLAAAALWKMGGLAGLGPALARAAAAAVPAAPLDVLEAWAIPLGGSVLATELVTRVIAARAPSVARNASLAAGGMYVAVGLLPALTGVAAASFLPGLADPEQVLPGAARVLLPGFGYVVFAAAFISAVLSTVDSTLLGAAGLTTHNLLVPLLRITGERGRVMAARAGVAGFGVLAWWLALRSQGVSELVESASAFGGAGVLVTVSFGLFTRLGGPRTALTTLLGSAAAYMGLAAWGFPWPFLASLSVALALYLGGVAGGLLMARRAAGVETAG